jgi:ribonuclease P protein component
VRSSDIQRVFATAEPLHGDRVVVFLAPGTGGVAVVAGRRVGGAVQRNRARRILREAWRVVAPQIDEATDAVLVARAGIRGAMTQDLVTQMNQLLRSKRASR